LKLQFHSHPIEFLFLSDKDDINLCVENLNCVLRAPKQKQTSTNQDGLATGWGRENMYFLNVFLAWKAENILPVPMKMFPAL
jgi:hypothetical protein